jgi:hypothetical protein
MKAILFCAAVVTAALPFSNLVSSQTASSAKTANTTQSGKKEAGLRITCQVRTVMGTPVPGSAVRMLHLASRHTWIGITDAQGKVELSALPPGRYHFEARHLGLGEASTNADIERQSADKVELTLHITGGAGKPSQAIPPAGASASSAAAASTTAKINLGSSENHATNSLEQKKLSISRSFKQVAAANQPVAASGLTAESTASPDTGQLGAPLAPVSTPPRATPAGSAGDLSSSGPTETKAPLVCLVRSSSGTPVPNASVRIVHLASGNAWVGLTDEQGKLALSAVPTGRYRFDARHLGLGETSFEGEITQAVTAEIELKLRMPGSVQKTTGDSAGPGSSKIPGSSQRPDATAQLAGDVRTSKGLPVPGASVRALHLPSGQAWMSSTDDNGKFSIAELPPGRYRIEVRHLGLGESSQETTLAAASSAPIQLTLGRMVAKATSPTTQPAPHPAGPTAAAVHAAGTAASQAKAKTDTSKQPSGDATGHKKRPAFAQVEATGQTSASAELPDSSSANSAEGTMTAQLSNSDAFLINGTVGRGATAQSGAGFDSTTQDDAGDQDGKKKKKHAGSHSHSGRGQSSAGNSGQSVLEVQDIEDMAVGQRLKHLGSNKLRFTLYDQYSNSAANALPYALTDPNPKRISYYGERGGASMGGPLANDRTFFYVNYELDRHRNSLDVFETVPLAAERQGDFTARGIQLYDPRSNITGPRNPMGSVIPPVEVNPSAVALLKLIPLPNLPGFVQNYHRQAALPQAMDKVNARILHTISPKVNLQVFYNLVDYRGQNATQYPTLSDQQANRGQDVTVALSQSWSPRLLNETRFNISRMTTRNLNGFAFQQNVTQQLGIFGVSQNPIDYGVPTINLTNYTGITDGNPVNDQRQTFRLTDSIAYTLQKHTVRLGGEFRYRQIDSFSSPIPRGAFAFTGLMTGQLNRKGKPTVGTGSDLADFLLGLPQATSLQYGVQTNYLRGRGYVGYIQDDWRIHPRFSINYGARYEYVEPFYEKYNHLVDLVMNPDMTAVAMVIPGVTPPFGDALPDSLLRPNRNNWAPRVGIAWRPFNAGPVIRAGYGMFYNGSIYDQLAATMLNQPPFALAQTSTTSAFRVLTLNNGFPGQGAGVVPNTVSVDPSYQVGYAQIWNLTIEMPITQNFGMEVTYAGTKGNHLDQVMAPNQAAPGPVFGADLRRRIPGAPDFKYESSQAESLYNGLQVRVQQRQSHGFRFQTLYTFSKSMDDASMIGTGGKSVVIQDSNNIRADWGLSSFDVRHTLRNWLSWEPPFGDRRKWLRSGAGAALLSNWKISTITQISSGTHFTPTLSGVHSNGTGTMYSLRPDLIGDPVLPAGESSPFRFFNTDAFALPADQFGNAPRGSIVGPGLLSVDASVGRTFHFGEESRTRLEIRWEVQNVLNTVNYSGLGTILNTADFGRVKGTRPMRSMDVFMRVHY